MDKNAKSSSKKPAPTAALQGLLGRALAKTLASDRGATTVQEVLDMTDQELMRTRLFGKIALNKVHNERAKRRGVDSLFQHRITLSDPLAVHKCQCGDPICSRYTMEKVDNGGLLWRADARLFADAHNLAYFLRELDQLACNNIPDYSHSLTHKLTTDLLNRCQERKH